MTYKILLHVIYYYNHERIRTMKWNIHDLNICIQEVVHCSIGPSKLLIELNEYMEDPAIKKTFGFSLIVSVNTVNKQVTIETWSKLQTWFIGFWIRLI